MSRYIPFNPRVTRGKRCCEILRRETFSTPFGRRRTHSSPEILRLRKGSPSRFSELRRKMRADSLTATICLRNSAYMIFRFWGIACLGFTSKAENTPRCFVSTTRVLRVAHHYLECCFSKPIPPPKVPKTNSRIFDPLRKTENGIFRHLCLVKRGRNRIGKSFFGVYWHKQENRRKSGNVHRGQDKLPD